MIQQRCFSLRHYPIEDIFLSVFACNAWSSSREQQNLCSVQLLSELLFVLLLFAPIC